MAFAESLTNIGAALTIPAERTVSLERLALQQVAQSGAQAFAEALAKPLDFPPLRNALTPDDHVAITVGSGVSKCDGFLEPLLQELAAAGVTTPQVGVVTLPPAKWATGELAVTKHDPSNRAGLSYLASTKQGRRIYLNRTVVEAEQAVVVAEVRFNARGEFTGGADALFPAMSDTATMEVLGADSAKTVRKEANEVAWLLGAPFFLHLVRRPGGGVASVIGGLADSFAEASRVCGAVWTARCSQTADIVIAEVSGCVPEITIDDFAAALANAARIVRPGGTIALVSSAAPSLGEGWELLRGAESAAEARRRLRKCDAADRASAEIWRQITDEHRVLVGADWPAQLIEDLFATPLEDLIQLQRVVDAGGLLAVLSDAERTKTELVTA